MICTFLERPTDLDVHPKKRFAFLAKIVEIDVAEVGTQNNENCSMWPGQTRFESCWWQFFCSFLTFWYAMHYFFLLVLRFWEIGKIDIQKCKKSRLSLLVSRPWRGPLRHVCCHTNQRTTVIHAFLESPSNLDVHPGIRFWIFEKMSLELPSKSTLYGYVMLTKGSIALLLRANY